MMKLFKKKSENKPSAVKTDAKPDKCFDSRRAEYRKYVKLVTHNWSSKDNLIEDRYRDWYN